MSSPKNAVTQWTSATISLLQTTKRVNRKTIIASNNKANEFSVTVTILPSLSTFFVAKTQIHDFENSALSTNVPPESLATKYSSLNIPNDLFSAKEIKEHSLAVSSNTSVMTPEMASTTSTSVTGNGIILPPSSVDKRYLSTSQTGDNFNADNSQGAFTKSAFSDVHRERLKSAQTAQFSSSNSILGRLAQLVIVLPSLMMVADCLQRDQLR
ncbi:hypothetical protein OS493_032272 [Desmophyllum pertusum]|uniref:Uncharacterized protein n=1 Tax=Desmophyllum pertusum TaxID=174260 RepID=A0A9W9Z8L4_9CNID|nr:hypothetical protein OS493_032272 [Desmophyllum pertusum]